jgi:alpha-L-rhamnosidase
MYRTIAGIAPAAPGYRAVTIEPRPGGGITSGGGKLDSPYGEIATAWTVRGGRLELRVTVPVNATATVILPAPDPAKVTEGGQPVAGADGVAAVSGDGRVTRVSVGSGSYVLTAPV